MLGIVTSKNNAAWKKNNLQSERLCAFLDDVHNCFIVADVVFFDNDDIIEQQVGIGIHERNVHITNSDMVRVNECLLWR